MLRVEINKSDELSRLIIRMKAEADKRLDKMLTEGAFDVERETKKDISAHKSAGVTYKRRGIEHTASAPNNPPNSDTGNLLNNITVNKISGGYDVGSRTGAPYGLFLEFGTQKIQPRPWLKPVFDRVVSALVAKYGRKYL